MTSKTPSKPSSEKQQMPLAQLLHRGKPRYFLADLLPGLRSAHLLCCRLLSSPHNESSKPTLLSLEAQLDSSSKLLEDHLISLSAEILESNKKATEE